MKEDAFRRSVAFPAISTGVFGYPFDDASRIALRTVVRFLREHDSPEKVRFVLFGAADHDRFREVLRMFESGE